MLVPRKPLMWVSVHTREVEFYKHLMPKPKSLFWVWKSKSGTVRHKMAALTVSSVFVTLKYQF